MNPVEMAQQSMNANMVGQTIGNYRVISKLGEGGMGSVYLGEHPLIGKKVAIKVLHDEFVSNPDVVSRFFNEAKAVNDIGHPNIVDIIDFGQMQAGKTSFVYFIMEFLAGEGLSALLQREAPLSPERVMHILRQCADCLRASHAKGIIHRDIKPDNIFLVPRGQDRDFVKVLDFGIAKLTGNEAGSRKTRTGIVMGTPAYMSPEQCEGRGNIDHRTDIYALGVVMYEMLTGRVPFLGEGYGEVLVQHLTRPPERPTTIRGAIPPSIEAIVMKTLEKRREDRFQSMEQFMEALSQPEMWAGAGQMGMAGLGASHGMGNQGQTISLTAPMPPHMVTPPPGLMRPPTIPGMKRPTTLGEGAGEVGGAAAGLGYDEFAPPKSKKGLFIGLGAVVVVGGAIAAVLAMGGGKKDNAGADPSPSTSLEASPSPSVEISPSPSATIAASPSASPSLSASPSPSATANPSPSPSASVEPSPSPVAATTIKLSFLSKPAGAEVWQGANKLCAKTPCSAELDKSATTKGVFTFKLAGFNDKEVMMSLLADAEVKAELKKATVVARPGGDKTKPGGDKTKPGGDKTKPGGDKVKPSPTPKPDDDGVLAPTFK